MEQLLNGWSVTNLGKFGESDPVKTTWVPMFQIRVGRRCFLGLNCFTLSGNTKFHLFKYEVYDGRLGGGESTDGRSDDDDGRLRGRSQGRG